MQPWKLNRKEVHWYGGSGGSIRNRTNARQPRNLDARSLEISLVHIPTKIEVHGELKGNYSRKEMTEQRKALYQQLFLELEDKVAKHLRIPKR